MLTTQKKSELRAVLFRHLDGIVTAPVAFTLHEKGVLDYLLEKEKATLKEITTKFSANEGYLNVGLRVLASQGFLIQSIDNVADEVSYAINDRSKVAFAHFHLYEDVFRLMQFSEKFHPRKFEVEPFEMLNSCFKNYKNNFGIKLSNDDHSNSTTNFNAYRRSIGWSNNCNAWNEWNVSQIFYGNFFSSGRVS
jgi:hypothetical protein